jgi:hypothetical protein
MANYKVWAHIERESADGDYEDVDEPVQLGEGTLQQMRKLVDRLSDDGDDSQGFRLHREG